MDISKFTEEDWEAIIYGDSENFKPVTEESIVDTDRWHNYFERVFQHKSGRFVSVSWKVGATEYQECDLNPLGCEVRPVEKMVTVYEAI